MAEPNAGANRIPRDIPAWNETFSENEAEWVFGREPSEMARLTAAYWRLLHGEKPARVLDLGSGEGRDTVFFTRKGFAVTAIEGTDAGVRKTRRLAEENGVEVADLRQMDVREFPLSRDYDIYFSNNCLQFLGAECLPTLRSIQKATRPGGLNAISAFTREAETLVGLDNLYRFDRNELKFHYRDWRLLRYSEEILWREPVQNYLSFASIIAQKGR